MVIAGMGGALTIRILEKGFRILPSLKELVLQPQSEIARVRNWLADRGYCIEREDMVEEEGKYYPMFRAVWGGKTGRLRPEEALYGPLLLQNRHPVLLRYLQKERERKKGILAQIESRGAQNARERRQELLEALEENGRALSFFAKQETAGCREME